MLIGVVVLIFIIIAANYPPHLAEFYIPTSMCAVALIFQLGYIYDLRAHWDSMSASERDARASQAIYVPPLVAVGSFVALAGAAIALTIWIVYLMMNEETRR